MKLRLTLIALALFAFTALMGGAVQYYQSLKANVLAHAQERLVSETAAIANRIETFLNGNVLADRALAGLDPIRAVVRHSTPAARASADRTLTVFRQGLGATVCYIMDRTGLTVAASNHDRPGSFVGKNYGFRPYFQAAMAGEPAVYLAKGVTSGKRGIYYSEPIRTATGKPIGVAVIKTNIHGLESEIRTEARGGWLLASPAGLIFATDRPDWRYRLLWEATPARLRALSRSRQFGAGPVTWSGLRRVGERQAEDRRGRRLFFSRVPFALAASPGWSLFFFRPEDAILSPISDLFLKHRKMLVFLGGAFGSVLILILYLMARADIARRKRVHDVLHQKNEYLRALHEISLGLKGRLDFRGVVETLLARAGALTGTDHGFFYGFEPDRNRLELQVGLGRFQDRVGIWIEPGKGVAGRAYAGGLPLYLPDCAAWEGWKEEPPETDLKSLMAMPLATGGQILGVMGLGFSERKIYFGDREREILVRFSELATIALDNARLYASLQDELAERQRAEVALKEANETLTRMVLIDGLTQIANRRCFDGHLAAEWRRMIRAGLPLGLLLCDVDHFKRYNDEYGHQAGDDCLRIIAETIAGMIHREGDLVARYGGEEFAVILSGADGEGTFRIAERIRQAVAAKAIAHTGNADIGIVTISIGASVAYPDVDSELESLLKAADRALYRAKSGGRNLVVAAAVEGGRTREAKGTD